jgi:hypothetical protein
MGTRVSGHGRTVTALCAVLAAAAILVGCGSSGSSVNELVVLDFQGHFDFRLDENDGPEHVFEIDSETTIDEDGRGRLTTDGKVHEFDVPALRLAQISGLLANMDWDRLEEDFGSRPDDSATYTLTYKGRTVRIDAVLDTEDSLKGEARSETARSFFTLVAAIDSVSQSPEQAAEIRRERVKTGALLDCLTSRDSGCPENLP